MSNIDKQALRERYSLQPAPKCHICGAEMTIQRMSASLITYGCTGATYDDKGCHYAEGRSIADDHYEQSRVTVVDVSDPDVLALLDELEVTKQERENWRISFDNERYRADKLAAAFNTEHEQLLMANGALITQHMRANTAEKRIAELEARTVNLQKRSVGEVMHMSGFSRDYAEGWCAGNDNAIHEIRTAGIKVKES
ncbi:TPA: ead/Ea22-like family protein [Salmonella enterica subsp. enterica serovar Poona]|nr:ead/Ea22-like family protein [Salmonella enterica]EKB5040433.1 ead/Ea22-like family protein [Salmonella enterica]EME1064898.1 ead/Ea22-like family protein [Salmonella enterica]HEC9416437.1 ead/Ea22-like family protein [Salmonella enterica subsp. enterica serovar Poona]